MSAPAILAIGLVIGAIVGTFVALMIHFSTPTPINVGTFTLTTAPTTAPLSDKDLYATYAGSSACRECHAREYEAWSKSHHSRAERDPDPVLDQKAFAPSRNLKHGTQETQVRLQDGSYQVITLGYDPKPIAYTITRVIGVDPLRQFLVPTTAGRFQVLEASYDPNKDQWFNVYGNEDRKPGEWGHWTGRGMNWNSQCAACHNTRVRKNYDEKLDAYDTKMAQLTVSCESCHGPMKVHALSPSPARAQDPSFAPNPSPRVGEGRGEGLRGLTRKFSKDQTLDTCASCHDPHSSKTIFPGNNLCMRCHNGSFKGSPTIVPEQHSFHKSDSPGNQCINCHMPITTYMQRHARHDHGFTIPDPLLTREHKIPNACNRCHADKDADWSLAAVDKWYGPKMQRPTRERAQWIARARRQDEAARQPILRMLKEEKQPFWQAVAASILSQWTASPDVVPALISATAHPDPLVRENAARALEPLIHQNQVARAMGKIIDDPVRAVRVRAAWAFRDVIDGRARAGADLFTFLRHNNDQPGGAMQQGVYRLARNDVDGAIACFERAVKWDPNSAPFHESLATALSMQEKLPEAIDQLQQAMRLDPTDAEYPFKLALAYHETGQTDRTIQLLQQALKLNPRHARAAYNLGLALDAAGNPEGAIAQLRQAESLNPADPGIPYARATIHLKQNQKAEAREAASRALQVNPQFQQAARLLQTLRE
jgi:predicted CXXCH cytochrome family protein